MSNEPLLSPDGKFQLGLEKQYFQYFEQNIVSKMLIFYINEEIHEPQYYTEMFHRIKTAAPNDIVYIHINTPGGCLSTGVQMINAMHSSQAKIVTVLEAQAESMGAILFLAGDEFIVNSNTTMMFHHYSSGTFGKGHEQLAQATATVEWYAELMQNICHPFLSVEEIDHVLKGEDIWLSSEKIKARLIKMINIKKKEIASVKTKKKK